MEDDRPVKSLLYGELTEGTRPVGRPKLTWHLAKYLGDDQGMVHLQHPADTRLAMHA